MGALEVMKLEDTKREAKRKGAQLQIVGRADHFDGRWQAVAQRDGRFDGVFVYAVRSTGIYCRPSCPSRRPQPEQVIFFLAPGAAERAGFRPCRRCRPHEIATRHPHAELVERACRAIETSMDDSGEGRLSLGALERRCV